jgi:O-antigen ligase
MIAWPSARSDMRGRALKLLLLVLAALISAAVGAGIVAFASRYGSLAPIVAMATVLVPLAVAAILADQRLAVVLVFLAFPIGFKSVSIWFFQIQAVDAAILAVTALVLLRRFGTGERVIRFSWPLAWLLALSFWALVLVQTAEEQRLAIKHAGSLVSGLVIAVVVVTVCSSIQDVRRLLGALAGVGALMTIPALLDIGNVQAYYGATLVTGRPEGIFVEPNELGTFCSMVGFTTAGIALGTRKRSIRWAAAVVIAILLVGLLVSLSRGAWLGTIAGLLLLVMTLRGARRALLAFGIPIVMVAILLGNFAGSNPEVQVVQNRFQAITSLNQPYDHREDLWAEAIRQIQEHPVTGQGPGNFAVASERRASESLTVFAWHAHNLYLNVGAELGVPGLTLLVALMITLAGVAYQTLKRLPEATNQQERAMVAGLASALLSLAVIGIFHVFLGNAILEPTTWVLVGCLLVSWRWAKNPGRTDSGSAAEAQPVVPLPVSAAPAS